MTALNWDKSFAMEQAADDADLLIELLEIFKDSLKSDIGLIETGVKQKNTEMISNAAHSIKGAAASLGIQGINEVAIRIETDSQEGSFEIVDENLSTLRELMAQLLVL